LGEVVELTPSRTRPQGIAKIKWTTYNQKGEAVYTFTPISIVPRSAHGKPHVPTQGFLHLDPGIRPNWL
jgi:hypothetical protein